MVEVLKRYGVKHPTLLTAMAQGTDRMVTNALNGGSGSTGFDPLTHRPSVSKLDYQHMARNREQLLADKAAPTPQYRGNPEQAIPNGRRQRRIILPPGVTRPEAHPQPEAPSAEPSRSRMPWM